LTFTVLREGEPKDVKVTLGKAMEMGGNQPEGARTCAFLGVLTVPLPALSDDTLDRLGLGEEDGLVVVEVVPGSPAAGVGLRHGDLIRSIDGKEIRDPDALRSHVHQTGPARRSNSR
jgi:S1-C subfamily serine protease